MSATPYIPAETAKKLNGEFPKGTRHQAALEIAIPLIGNGLSPNATYQTLRDKFPADVTDDELQKVVRWAVDKRPTPSGYGKADFTPQRFTPPRPATKAKKTAPIDHAKWWLEGFETTLDRFIEQSPVKVPTNPKESCILTLELLYAETECVNVVCKYIETDKKANPQGGGKTMTAPDWIKWVAENGVPSSRAGAWIRPNPCVPTGTGSDGAITNGDISSFRFLLIESDDLPLDVQLAIYLKLKLPISAVLLSGGKSAHAWAKIDAKDEADYYTKGTRILKALAPFGIDQSNKNPSRLSRLPGSRRSIGAVGDGLQRLLWINPKQQPVTDESLQLFEDSLAAPIVDERPFRRVFLNAIPRYEEMIANRGKLGIPTGIADFDKDTGGLKNGHMTIIAAETNGGKSTLAVNIVNTAASRGHGVALFTLEMDRDEICDLIISMNCSVDRNCFNTGEFKDEDIQKMVNAGGMLSRLPLWIEDDPTLTAAQIEQRVIQLKKEGGIELVVIDYAQIISPDDPRAPREQQVASIVRALRSMAKKVKLPLVVLSQLNDDGKLRESRVIAHEAHNVIVLETDPRDLTLMTMKVCKGRRIAKRNYDLKYEPAFCRIASLAKISNNDYPNNEP